MAATAAEAEAASSAPATAPHLPWMVDIEGSGALLLAEVQKLRPGAAAKEALGHLEKLIEDERLRLKFVHRYVVARSGRYTDAAQRLLNFCDLLKDYPHLTIDRTDPDVLKGQELAFLRIFPIERAKNPALEYAIELAIDPSKLDYEKISVAGAQKFWLATVFIILMQDGYPAQLNGVAGTGVCTHIGQANVKLEFQRFLLRALSCCLPVRVKIMVMVDVPFLLKGVMLPVFKMGLSSKIYSRLHLTDTDGLKKLVGNDLRYLSDAFPDGQWKPSSVPTAADLACIKAATNEEEEEEKKKHVVKDEDCEE